MKFIKRKVNPHYLSDLGSMNQSKCIIAPRVSLLTVFAFLNLECRAFCSRMRSQQIHCIWSLQVHLCVKAIHRSEHFLFVWMCSFICVCVFICVYVCVYICVYVCDIYKWICLHLHVCCDFVCVSRCVHLIHWFLRTSLGNIAWALKGLKISSILLW